MLALLVLGIVLGVPAAHARQRDAQLHITGSELIAEVNALRAANGLPAYSAHPVLMQIAQNQAVYLAVTGGSAGHYSADGLRPFQRALQAGYPVAGDLSLGGWFSENWMDCTGRSAAEAIQAWTGDAPHTNTMLHTTLRDIGGGVASSGGRTYCVLDAGLASGTPVEYTPPAGTFFGTPGTPIVSQFMLPVMVSTPMASGELFHEVQYGQTLWSIAVAYTTTVNQLRSLNGISGNEIYEGQRLLVGKLPSATPRGSETPAPSLTPTQPPDSSTATMTPTLTTTPDPAASPGTASGGFAVAIIIATAIIAASAGTWISLRRAT